MAEFGDVLAAVDDGVGTVTLNRPARHNSLTIAVLADLEAAIRFVGAHPDCRAVVLTGAGRSFCSGMDLATRLDDVRLDDGDEGDPVSRAVAAMRVAVSVTVALRQIPQPVIAAVTGHAVGGGLALTAAADLRICSPSARFNAVFVRIGMSAGDMGLSWLLPRLVGFASASELFFRGGVWDAADAERVGYVAHVVDDPLAVALAIAAEMAARPPLGITMTKELLNASIGVSGLLAHLELELRSQAICSQTVGHLAALDAFADRPRAVTDDQ